MKPIALALVFVLGALARALAREPAPPQPDASTLLFWHLDEGEGETAGDTSPGGRLAGKVSGARWVEGRFGKALAWGPENGTVQVKGDFSALKDAFTLQAWVRLDELPTGKHPFWTADVAGRLGAFLMTIRPPGVLYVGVQLGGQPNYLHGQTRIETGKWTHLALVYDGAAGKIATFVDGKVDLEADVAPGSPREVNDSGNAFWIRSYGGGDEKLVGAIDEVSLSTKAITFGHRWQVPVYFHVLRYASAFLVGAQPGGITGLVRALRVTVSDAAGKRVVERDVTPEDAAAGMVLPAPGLAAGTYHARIDATRRDGTEDTVLEREVRYTPPDTRVMGFTSDGVCLVRGKPFFPLGLYHVRQSDLKLVAEGGFNLAMSQPPAAIYPAGAEQKGDGVGFIEQCAGLGLMSVGKGGIYHRPEAAASLFAHYRGDPNLLFWYAYDEPGGSGVPVERPLKTYDEWAAADPTHPVFLLDNVPGQFLRFAQACDVFATDPYPIRKDDNPRLEHVAEYTRAAVQAVFGKKPVWVALQAYTVKAVSDAGKNRDGVPRLATQEELRCMAYLALASGARGILFYAFDDTYYNNGSIRGVNLAHEYPVFWGHLKALATELKGRADVWTAPYSPLRPENLTPAVVVQERPYRADGRTHLLAVNPAREAQAVRIRLPGAPKGGAVRDALSGKQLRLNGEVLEDTLGPREPRCYVVDGE